jgi:hypothetical protein
MPVIATSREKARKQGQAANSIWVRAKATTPAVAIGVVVDPTTI